MNYIINKIIEYIKEVASEIYMGKIKNSIVMDFKGYASSPPID